MPPGGRELRQDIPYTQGTGYRRHPMEGAGVAAWDVRFLSD